MTEPSPLRRLAGWLARGRSIDWDAEERAAASERERAAIRNLRLLAAMCAMHQEMQNDAVNTDVPIDSSLSVARSVTGFSAESAGPVRPTQSTDPASPSSLAAGSRWGPFEILEPAGSGAFGEVYRARDTRLDRIVALKLLTREASGPADEVVREARILARVRHPDVVTVHGADRIDGRVGIWMEFLEGETLEQIVRARGTLDAREAALIGIDLCRGLSAVHAAGIVHQDVKLANVMRAEGGRIVLMDFGLGRDRESSLSSGSPRAGRGLSGTPLFMAPEVLRGERASVRSDLYSVGVVLYALVTGAVPVQASSLAKLIERHQRGGARAARDLRPDLPEAFVHVLERILSADPRNRFATAGEVERALLHTLGSVVQSAGGIIESSRRRRRQLVLVGAGALAILAASVLVWHATRKGPDEAGPIPFSDAPTLTLLGHGHGEMLGGAMSCVGDVDQDGYADALIGAPAFTSPVPYAGKIYLYRGSATGLDPNPVWSVTYDDLGARLGWSIASETNLSFDGYPDLVVSAPGPDSATATLGRIFVYVGSKDGFPRVPTQVISDSLSGTRFGYSIATGDVDHDGFDDLLVGEPGYPNANGACGRALLYSARGGLYGDRPLWVAKGPPGSEFGCSVDMGGDLNNDGFRDAVIGAMTASFGPVLENAGAAYVYLGSAAGLDSFPIVIAGRQANALTGGAVLIPGDLDGDGFADLLVGSEESSNGERSEGTVEIYFGAKTGIDIYGSIHAESNAVAANLGGHLASLGDVNGDGHDEFFAGAVRYQRTEPREGAGFVYSVLPGRTLRRIWFRTSGKAGSWYGGSAASGDFDGDRRPDLLVSAPAWDNETGINTGRVDLFVHRPSQR